MRTKIVQLLMTPDTATWQQQLLGLGSNGVTYWLDSDANRWWVFIGADLEEDPELVTLQKEAQG